MSDKETSEKHVEATASSNEAETTDPSTNVASVTPAPEETEASERAPSIAVTTADDESTQERQDASSQSRAVSSSTRAGSKPGSSLSVSSTPHPKGGQARSSSGTKRSGKSEDGSRHASSRGTRTGSRPSPRTKGSKPQSADAQAAETPGGGTAEGLPEGVHPVFLTTKTQDIFQLRSDEDVTADKPYKLLKKEDIVRDLHHRAAVSDFHPLKQQIQDYPDEDLLIFYDPEFKFGQNFFIAITTDGKLKLEESLEKIVEPDEDIVCEYVPPVAKEWVSMGSEREIEDESYVDFKSPMSLCVKRIRREFGAPVEFNDTNAANAKDAKEGYIHCASYTDDSFTVRRMELNKSVQAIAVTQDSSAQTDWKFPKNAAIQYEPREFTEEEKKEILDSEELDDFLKSVLPRFELALQQNEIMDVFYNDWANLAIGDSSFGSKADNHLKEFQSFTDLDYSKDRSITCIDWHPTIRGTLAVSVGQRMSFDDRVDHMHKIIMVPSLILIWSFTDPIHPQLLLEAPDDILCFRFSPTNPNIVAGGCINGQVVLWDISQYAERLRQPRSGKAKEQTHPLQAFDDDDQSEIPIVRYAAVSSIEHSHCAPITELQWVPDHFEISRMGEPLENKSGQCVQLMTCATDHVVLFWDIRPPRNIQHQETRGSDTKVTSIIPTTFKHLDQVWRPSLKVSLFKTDPGGDHAPTKFTMREVQGDRSALKVDDELKTDGVRGADTMIGSFSFGGPKPATGGKRILTTIKTQFYVGTEDGELVYVDWMPQKDQESGKIQTMKPEFYHSMHEGPVVTLQRSPFYRDILLCVGGWTFTIWKEGVNSGPLLHSPASEKRLTAGHWSPSRPAVFYIAKQDGSIDIWDLLDRTHEPCMTQNVSTAPITSLYPLQITNKQQLLSVGDGSGTLHVFSVPWSLRQPTTNEVMSMKSYIEREIERRAFVVARWDFREQEKMEMEAEAKRKAGIAPQVVLTDEEIEYRMRLEYQAYLDEEATFLRALGLKEDVQPIATET